MRGVRLGQYRPDVARVVVDLTAAAPYQILREGPAVVISFDVQPESPVDAPRGHHHDRVARRRQATPNFHYNASAPHVYPYAPSKKVSYPSSSLRVARRTDPALSRPGIVRREGSNPHVRSPRRKRLQQATAQAGNAAATVGGAPQAAAVAAPSRYTGEPISVNLKDVDLARLLPLDSRNQRPERRSGPRVKGTLTIVLDEVPWDQALDIVLQNNGLDKQLHGNVLAHRDARHHQEGSRDRARRAESGKRRAGNDHRDPRAQLRQGRHAQRYAEEVPDRARRYSFRYRSNQLIIRDIPSVIPTIDNLIHQLDRKSQQVEIEARVVSATRAFAQDIGTELGFAGTTTGGRSLFSGSPAVGGSGVTTGPGIPVFARDDFRTGKPPATASTAGIPLSVNLGAGVPTSGFGFSHRSPNFAVDFFITAAESKGVGKLLSKPRIVTQNNEKATVKQGVKIPIQTTINNTISVQYIDAVLKLEVTPQITAEGTMFMDVLVENTQIDQGIPRIQGVPALDTQSAESKITVADGATIVVGGVIITSSQVNITQVPILGSLPLIGNLFRRNNDQRQYRRTAVLPDAAHHSGGLATAHVFDR